MKQPARATSRKKPASGGRKADTIEWIAGIVSAILLCLLLGYLVVEAVLATGGAPELILARESVRQVDDHFVLEVKVRNAGETTASDVVVTGTLGGEVSTVTLDYVPPGSGVRAALAFPSDPSAAALRIEGYTRP